MRASRLVSLALLVPLITLGLPAGPAGAQGGGSGNLVLPDPVGDVGPFGVGVPDNPAMAPWGHVDITRLEFGNEEADTFDVILGVAGFDTPTMAGQAAALQDFRCYIEWTYDHDAPGVDYHYQLRLQADLLRMPGNEPGDVAIDWYWRYTDDDQRVSRSDGEWDAGEVAWDDATSAFVIEMPKAWAPVWPGGHGAGVGDALVPLWASCATDIALYGYVYDYLFPPEGSSYAFRNGGRGEVIQLGFDAAGNEGGTAGPDPSAWNPPTDGGSAAHVAPVAAGRATKVPVYVTNQADARKLVQLTVAPTEGSATDWNLSLVDSVMVPAGEARVVNLIATPPPGASPGETLSVTVDAKAAGEPISSTLSGALRVTPILSAEHDTFHIHSARYESSHPVNQVFYEAFPPYELHASLLESEPGFDDESVPVSPLFSFGGYHHLDPLVDPVRLDADEPVTVNLAFEGDATRSVRVSMYLMTEEHTLVALRETVPGDGVTTLEAWIDAEDMVELDAGTEIYFELGISPAGIGPGSASEVRFVPRESTFTLPVMAGSQSHVYTDGRYLPSLALARGEESTTYLNPGKEYAFDLVLSNEGVDVDDIRLVVNATNATGWDIDVEPGKAFRVQPGNSTPFSVVVRAPDDAAEGDRAVLDVIARSKHNDAVRTQVRLDVIVTTGVDVEEKRYEEKEGQLAPLEEESAEASAGSFVAAVVALGVAVASRRRRP